jgi:hypothetical protein
VRADSLRGVIRTLVSDVRDVDVTLWGEESDPATGKERQVNDDSDRTHYSVWPRIGALAVRFRFRAPAPI